MSILIRGMEMPSDCSVCPLETDFGTCGYYSFYVEAGHDSDYRKRRDDCPLTEVPAPHGRLIDADALKKKWLEAESRMGADKVINLPLREYISNGCVYDLDQAQTIIEAEDGI